MELNGKQIHYFKRQLITEELKSELDQLGKQSDITSITSKPHHDFPFLTFIFQHFILPFPLLQHTSNDERFWTKIKTCLEAFYQAQPSHFHTPYRSTLQTRTIQHRIFKFLTLAFCASIKTTGPDPSLPLKSLDLPRPLTTPSHPLNIVTVRLNQTHPEFIIESRPGFYVARRHGDFRRLQAGLKKKREVRLDRVPVKQVESEGFYREADRRALRGWLRGLVGLGQDELVLRFLTDRPVELTAEDRKDIELRAVADQVRRTEEALYQKELDRRVLDLNETLDELKKKLVRPGGLIEIFEVVKSTPSIQDLPDSLKKAFEWGRINFAFALHKQFIALDISIDNFEKLRRTHRLIPYKTLSVILKFSNPISMMKGVFDLFLAQPFGRKSLLQRLIIANINEESKTFQKKIDRLKEEIKHDSLCKKIYNAVRTPIPEGIDRRYRTKTTELLLLLKSDIEPILSLNTIEWCMANPHLIHQTIELWELYTKQHEQELLLDLVFQGVTGELLREFMTVFYQPLAQVYKAADIGVTIRHVASFIDDLIELVEMIRHKKPNGSNSIQPFIDLVQRHEQNFYSFVHNVHTQDSSKVFDEIIQYLDRIFTFVADGLPGQLDLNQCVQQAGIQTVEGYRQLEQEIDTICEFRHQQKLNKIEKRKQKISMQTGREESASDILQFMSNRNEMIHAIEDLDDFEDDDPIHEYSRHRHSSIDSVISFGDNYENEEKENDLSDSSVSNGSRRSSQLSNEGFDFPKLNIIPKILPHFVNQIMYMIKD